VLNNTLYIGHLSWNRCSYVKDPRTGRRLARVNANEQREEVEVPHLRIVDQILWDRVRSRQADVHLEMGRDADGNALNRMHRRRFLLGGLLACGHCGGGYTVIGKDRYGCATRRSKGTCDNARTITRQRIEQRVLSGLKDRLLAPELVAEFVRAFAEEMANLQRQAASEHGRLREELADVERRLEGVMRAIEGGAWSETLNKRLSDLEPRKADLLSRRARQPSSAPVIRLHPNTAELYPAKVADLEAALNAPGTEPDAAEALRVLIDASFCRRTQTRRMD
jgi:hypothetical protein